MWSCPWAIGNIIFFGPHRVSAPIIKQNKNQMLVIDVIKLHASYVHEK
jgi:hypothetical protein